MGSLVYTRWAQTQLPGTASSTADPDPPGPRPARFVAGVCSCRGPSDTTQLAQPSGAGQGAGGLNGDEARPGEMRDLMNCHRDGQHRLLVSARAHTTPGTAEQREGNWRHVEKPGQPFDHRTLPRGEGAHGEGPHEARSRSWANVPFAMERHHGCGVPCEPTAVAALHWLGSSRCPELWQDGIRDLPTAGANSVQRACIGGPGCLGLSGQDCVFINGTSARTQRSEAAGPPCFLEAPITQGPAGRAENGRRQCATRPACLTT